MFKALCLKNLIINERDFMIKEMNKLKSVIRTMISHFKGE